MADVRSMLRGERDSRRVKHSQAAYTSTGQLMCSVCRCPVKSAAWDAHLQSDGHTALVQKIRSIRHSNPPTPEASSTTNKRKRKPDADEGQATKRRNVAENSDALSPGPNEISNLMSSPPPVSSPSQPLLRTPKADQIPASETSVPKAQAGSAKRSVDEDEWEAFEREMKQLDEDAKRQKAQAKGHSATVISAPAVSAEELAAQAREEQSAQKGAGEAEAEGDREDAQRQTEEEFARMDELDERMRAWRAKQESLRNTRALNYEKHSAEGAQDEVHKAGQDEEEEDDDDNDEDDEDDDEEDDAWQGLGGL